MTMHSAAAPARHVLGISASMPAGKAVTCWNVTLPAVSTGAPPVVCSNWLISAASVGFCTGKVAPEVRLDDLQSRSRASAQVTNSRRQEVAAGFARCNAYHAEQQPAALALSFEMQCRARTALDLKAKPT
jgi:hypothetical protein